MRCPGENAILAMDDLLATLVPVRANPRRAVLACIDLALLAIKMGKPEVAGWCVDDLESMVPRVGSCRSQRG